MWDPSPSLSTLLMSAKPQEDGSCRTLSITSRTKEPQNLCLKFIITSRPIPRRKYTTRIVQNDPSQSHIEQDLRLVIRAKVEDISQRVGCKLDVKDYLENALVSKADRTFLCVTLVLHQLEKSFLASRKDFKRIIDEMPQTFLSTYNKFLVDIPAQYQSLAAKLLRLLIASSRPLSLDGIKYWSLYRALITVWQISRKSYNQTSKRSWKEYWVP